MRREREGGGRERERGREGGGRGEEGRREGGGREGGKRQGISLTHPNLI